MICIMFVQSDKWTDTRREDSCIPRRMFSAVLLLPHATRLFCQSFSSLMFHFLLPSYCGMLYVWCKPLIFLCGEVLFWISCAIDLQWQRRFRLLLVWTRLEPILACSSSYPLACEFWSFWIAHPVQHSFPESCVQSNRSKHVVGLFWSNSTLCRTSVCTME